MKILIFNYEYPPVGGGGGVVNKYIAEGLVNLHEITVVTSHYSDLPRDEIVNGVRVIRLESLARRKKDNNIFSLIGYFLNLVKNGQKIIEDVRPDIINTHFSIPVGLASVRLSNKNKIPNVLCLHGDMFSKNSLKLFYRKKIVAWILNNVDFIVAKSESVVEDFKKYFSYKGEIKVIDHGIIEPDFKKVDRQKLGFKNNDFIIVTVGRLLRRKSTEQIIKILGNIDNKETKLVIIGDGPEKEFLVNMSKAVGVSERVIFTGQISDESKYKYLNISDIFVSTSQYSENGIGFLEALNFGLPIISYDKGRHAEILIDGQTGFLIPLNDKRTYEKKLEYLINDKDLRYKIRKHNEEFFDRFNAKKCIREYNKVFMETNRLVK
jgi:glycosyltransferase involved in cell wall biosynthesis